MKSIENYLKNLKELFPLSTGETSKIDKKGDIKSVIFDIYGTLVISASGDIDKVDVKTQSLKQSMRQAGFNVANLNESDLDEILLLFKETIKESHQTSKDFGIPFPEIEITSIWKAVFSKYDNARIGLDNANISVMAFVFELLSNKVFPMPNMILTLDELKKRKIPLGIVSNAQFYTPIMMNYFIGGNYSDEEFISGFEKNLHVYSYKEKRAKPDYVLFEKLVPILKEKYNMSPGEVLFVGNDMLNDVYTASKVGFKTALFAGDKRSLRKREDKHEVRSITPDYVITDLKQLLDIV